MSYMYLEGGMGYGGTASSVQGDLVGGESMFRPFRSYSDVLAMEDNSYMAGLQRAGFSVDGQGAAAAEPLPLLAGACEDLRMPDAVPVFVMLPLDTVSKPRSSAAAHPVACCRSLLRRAAITSAAATE